MLVILFALAFIASNRVSLCTMYADDAGLKLTEIHAPLPPEDWDLRCVPLPGLCCVYRGELYYL